MPTFSNEYTWKCQNALLVTRVVYKHLIQNCSDEVVVQLLDTPTTTPPPSLGTDAAVALEPKSLTAKGTICGYWTVDLSNTVCLL